MKALHLILAVFAVTVLVFTSAAFAQEYFLVKSRSGILRVVDHTPQGGATVVKGPFKSKQDAEQALSELKKKQFPRRGE
jgi:cell division septation protein DedD